MVGLCVRARPEVQGRAIHTGEGDDHGEARRSSYIRQSSCYRRTASRSPDEGINPVAPNYTDHSPPLLSLHTHQSIFLNFRHCQFLCFSLSTIHFPLSTYDALLLHRINQCNLKLYQLYSMTRMNQYYNNEQSHGSCNPSSAIRLRPHVPEANRFDLPSFVRCSV